MSDETVSGRCICGEVSFELRDHFDQFKLCHCDFCQKASGSAYVANAFTSPDNITWLTGTAQVSHYDVPGSLVRRAFCSRCGTTLPFVSQDGRILVVPVGVLTAQPTLPPQQIQFWSERIAWYGCVSELESRAMFAD